MSSSAFNSVYLAFSKHRRSLAAGGYWAQDIPPSSPLLRGDTIGVGGNPLATFIQIKRRRLRSPYIRIRRLRRLLGRCVPRITAVGGLTGRHCRRRQNKHRFRKVRASATFFPQRKRLASLPSFTRPPYLQLYKAEATFFGSEQECAFDSTLQIH